MGIVVDACVAQSASPNIAEPARSCRDVLDAIYSQGYAAVMSPDLQAEWKRHYSNYSRKWLRQMLGRKQVRRVSPQEILDLRAAIQNSGLSARKQAAADKDLHLVEAAASDDRRIISRDDKARAIFAGLSAESRPLRQVAWVTMSSNPTGWLSGGAHRASHELGQPPPR